VLGFYENRRVRGELGRTMNVFAHRLSSRRPRPYNHALKQVEV
jgi:hypothetical protein